VLIVDEADVGQDCQRVLTTEGYRVDTAADLATGLDLIRGSDRDVYLLDVELPSGSGLDLVDAILERDPTAICIVLAGHEGIELAVEAVQRGAFGLLSKPFTSDELLVTVSQGLEWRRLRAIEAQTEDLAQAKEELEKLDEVRSQWMLRVVHGLRTPAAAAQSYVNLILSGYVSEEEMRPTLTRVQERLQEMLDTISDLLALARLRQAGDQLAAEASPQPMADILNEACDLLREQALQKRQSLEVAILDRPTMMGDRDDLKQLWTNLIGNAIKYTPAGGRIVVRLQADSDNLVGVVEDSGIGIAEEDLPHLFQEFYRTDQAKASGETGTGLGLSIVRQIMESYGGTIEVESELGQGSRFTFILPLTPPTKRL
jgi:signal transduction histidine kinase